MMWDRSQETMDDHYFSLLGALICPTVILVQSLLLDRGGRTRMHRLGLVRHHSFKGVIKTVNFLSPFPEVLRSIGFLQLDMLDGENAEILLNLGVFTIGQPPRPQTDHHAINEDCPIMLFFSRFFLNLRLTRMEEYENIINILVLPDYTPCTHKRFGTLRMDKEDWDTYQNKAQYLGTSKPCQNLSFWAGEFVRSPDYTFQVLEDFYSWATESMNVLMAMFEFCNPGESVYIEAKSKVPIPMAIVRRITQRCGGGHYRHKVDPTTWYQMLCNRHPMHEPAADPDRHEILFNANFINDDQLPKPPPVHTEKKLINKLKIRCDKAESDLAATRMTLATVLSQNKALHHCLDKCLQGEDVLRNDGRRRSMTWRLVDDDTGEEVRRVNDEAGVIDPEADNSMDSDAVGRSLNVAEKWIGDDISDTNATRQIETIQSNIKARRMVKARRRLPQVVRYINVDSEDSGNSNDSTLSIGPDKATPVKNKTVSLSESSSSEQRESSVPGSDRSSEKSAQETPTPIRYSRRVPTDWEPMTPTPLRSKEEISYCHLDEGKPNYPTDYPTEEHRHPDLRRQLDLRDRYIMELEEIIAKSRHECRINSGLEMARAEALDKRVNDLRETLKKKSAEKLDAASKAVIEESLMDPKDDVPMNRTIVIGSPPSVKEVELEEEANDMSVQETEEEMEKINLRSAYEFEEDLPSPSPPPRRASVQSQVAVNDPPTPVPGEEEAEEADANLEEECPEPEANNNPQEEGPDNNHQEEIPDTPQAPLFIESGPSDAEWVQSDHVSSDPICVTCNKTKCDQEIECIASYLDMMKRADEALQAADEELSHQVLILLKFLKIIVNISQFLRIISDISYNPICDSRRSVKTEEFPAKAESCLHLSSFAFDFIVIYNMSPMVIRELAC